MGKDEPILEKIAQIYAKDIYTEEESNPTSRKDYDEEGDGS